MRRVIALLLLLALLTVSPGAEAAQSDWVWEGSMELQYATGFQVDYYAGGYKLIALADGSRFLTVPEGAQAPRDALPAGCHCPLRLPGGELVHRKRPEGHGGGGNPLRREIQRAGL